MGSEIVNYDWEMWKGISDIMFNAEKKILQRQAFDVKFIRKVKIALEKLDSIDRAGCTERLQETINIYDVYQNPLKNLIIKSELNASIISLCSMQEKIKKMIIKSEPLLKQVQHLYCESLTMKRCIEFDLIHEYCQWSETRIKYQCEYSSLKNLYTKFFSEYQFAEKEIQFQFDDISRSLLYEGEESYLKLQLENTDGLDNFKKGWVDVLTYLKEYKLKATEEKRKMGTLLTTYGNPMLKAFKLIKMCVIAVAVLILSSSESIEIKTKAGVPKASPDKNVEKQKERKRENARRSDAVEEEMDNVDNSETVNYERDKESSCICCKKYAHKNNRDRISNSLVTCDVFTTKMTVKERKDFVIENNLCFTCLRKGHRVAGCRYRDFLCKRCNGKHHRLICDKTSNLLHY